MEPMRRTIRAVGRAPRTRAPAGRDGSWPVSRAGRPFPAGGRRPLSVFRSAIVGVAVLSCSAGPARAHVPGDAGGSVVGLAAIVVASVVVSLLGGFALVVADGQRYRSVPSLGVAFGTVLVVSGGLTVSAAALDDPTTAVAGALAGMLVVRSFSTGSPDDTRRGGDGTYGRDRHAGAALGAVVAHRTIEGLTVAAVYTTGSAIGLLGAVVLAGHATIETIAVGGLYLGDRTRVLGATCLVQFGFVVGAVAGQATTVPLLPAHRIAVLAAVGGVLLVVGGREAYACLRSHAPADLVRRVRR